MYWCSNGKPTTARALKSKPIVFQRNRTKVRLQCLFGKAKLYQGLAEDLLLRQLRTAIQQQGVCHVDQKAKLLLGIE